MDKKMITPFKRFMSVLLCIAMVLPMLVVPAGAERIPTSDEPLAIIYAASDFQYSNNDYTTASNVMNKIINTVKANHSRMDGAFFLGDYSVNYDLENTNNGRDQVKAVLTKAWTNLNGNNIIYVQGNHDKAGFTGQETYKTQTFDHYNVFVMDNDMFPWQQGKAANAEANKKTVENTAEQLRTFLQGRLDANDDRPVFITSHVPLHYSRRSDQTGAYDNIYARKIFNVLDEYGKKLDIIFLFGHNHSKDYDDYIGGAAIYLPVGEYINIPKEQKGSGCESLKLNFTYMNGGYIGYYSGNCETKQSSSVFEIYEDRIEIARYDADGEANLKDMGKTIDGLAANTTVYTNNSPEATIRRKNLGVQMDFGSLKNGRLVKDGSGLLTIKGEYDASYTVSWSTDNDAAVGIQPSADGMSALVTGKEAGSATITAVVTEVSTTRAVGETKTFTVNVQVVETKATDPEVLIKAGNYTYFQKVQTVFAADDEDGKKIFAFIDMEKDGYTIGQQMALSKDDIFDMKENDNTTVYGTEYRPEHELNAQAVNVFQLPGTTGETLTLADIPNQNCWWTTWHEQSANTNNAQRNRVMTYRTDFANRFLVIKEDTGIFAYDSDLDRLRCKGSNPKTFGWRYDEAKHGLYTQGTDADYYHYVYYSQANSDFSAARYSVDTGVIGAGDDHVNSQVYAFQRQTITIANDIYANLDDVTGYVNKNVGYTNLDGKRLGGAKTGDKLILKNGNETLEIDVTIDMLSGNFDVTTPGVYSGLSIEYAGATVAEGLYTLVVNDTATLLKNDAAREYLDNIYVLTDTMVPGKQYLIVDDNEAGIAHAMGVSRSQVFAYNVLAQELPVNGSDKLYIDSSRYSWDGSTVTSADITASNLVGRGIVDQGDINALMSALPDTIADQRRTYQYAIRLVWSPTQLALTSPGTTVTTCNRYTAQSGYLFLMSQMQHAGYGKKFLSISKDAVDNQLELLAEPNTANTYWYNWKYSNGVRLNESQIKNHYLFYNFQNMIHLSNKGSVEENKQSHGSDANQNFQVKGSHSTYTNMPEIRRTWIYERVTDIDTVSARVSDKAALVTQRVVDKYEATSGATFTGDYILVETTHADGTVTTEQVPMTIDMLSGGFDLTKPGTYSNLTVTYQGVEICSDYTLQITPYVENNYPEFPEEGAVRIGKYLDTSEYNYLDTGVASIGLSVTGIPVQTGVDVVIILDTSSSMTDCVHNVNKGQKCDTCGVTVDTTNSRQAVLEDTLENMLTTLKEPINGYIPDIDVAIADFNGYTPINTDYMVPYKETESINIEQNQQVVEDKPDGSTVLVPFTSIAKLEPNCLNAKSKEAELPVNPGTNYDRAMDLAYELLSAKQKQNALNGQRRKSIVVFMSDGGPWQYNYFCGAPNQLLWHDYLNGTLDKDAFTAALEDQCSDLGINSEAVLNAFNDYYNSNGSSNKHWVAEAIKADPNSMVKVIDPDAMTRNHVTYVRGLGATMYSVGFGMAKDGVVTVETIDSLLRGIATDADHYKAVDNNEALDEAFRDIAKLIRSGSAKDAVFHDKMGAQFDLVTSNIVGTGNKTVDLRDHGEAPSIIIKQYELYKRSEVGTVVNGITVTQQMVGERKYTMNGEDKVENAPTILETVTFNDNGTVVSSDKKTGNILNGKVIEALIFFYNTDKDNAHDITVNDKVVSLAPETFYWMVGDVPQDELVMSYSVYLTGSMEGNREPDTYDTNEYADLTYVNHLGKPCDQTVPTPKLPWKQGTVGYAFYLVDKEGNPIINQTTGELGSFERSVEITQPVYRDFYWNETDANDNAATVVASVVAQDLPAGYTLFDKDAKYSVSLHSNGSGTYNVTKGDSVTRATTYIQGLHEYDVNPVGPYKVEESKYDTANTIVWFAVYADPSAQPDSVVIDYGIPVDVHVMVNDPHMNTHYAELVGVRKEAMDSAFTTVLADGFELNCEGEFGTLSIVDNGTNSTSRAAVRYTLNLEDGMRMSKAETFTYAVRYYGPHGKVGYHYSTVTIIPAANMYYEDSFLTFTDSTATSGDLGKWEIDASSIQVSCYNEKGWTQMYAFCEGDKGAAGVWPGAKMYDTNNDGIFTTYVSANQVGQPVIFNNGDLGNATSDLQLIGNAIYKLDGSWTQNGNYTTRVYFANDRNWENVKAYWWNVANENNGWPGTQISMDANGSYYVDVPAGMTAIIFNNGKYDENGQKLDGAEQTPDLVVAGDFRYNSDGSYVSVADEEAIKTVYFNPEFRDWENVYAYWWNSAGGNNGWPGAPMTYDAETGLFSIDVPAHMTNIKFHDNRNGITETLAEQIIYGADRYYRAPHWDYVSDTNEVIFDSTGSGWDVVYAYYWSGSNTSMSAWPGVRMTKGEGNLWNISIPAEAEYVIFNGGLAQTQTGDITLEASGTTYKFDGTNDNSSKDKVYYFKGDNWTEVYAYYWNGSGENADDGGKKWPGTKMTKDEETGLYSISVPAKMHSIIFNNGKHDENGNALQGAEQTADLRLPAAPDSVFYGDAWSTCETDPTVQDEDRPGSASDALENFDANNVYGYDELYGIFTSYSMGSAQKVTVDAITGHKNVAPKATFFFTGTGFDVVSITDNRSGAVMVEVFNTEGVRVRSTIVTNYYGYTYENGEWVVKTDASDCLYQVPVVKMTGLDYGTYQVVIRAAYMPSMDAQSKGSYTIWLDAIRTYNPAVEDDTSNDAYDSDNEANPALLMLRDILVKQGSFGTGNITGAAFIDGFLAGGVPSVEQYANQGPNNEVYLTNGQAIAFELVTNTNVQPTAVHIGAKLAAGNKVTLKVNNGELAKISSASNMFYALDIDWTQTADGKWSSGTIVVSCEADAGNILSLTDMKVTSTNGVTFAASTEENADDVLNNASEPVVLALTRRSTMSDVRTMMRLSGCEHEWIGGNCTTPKTCSKCGETEGDVVHNFNSYHVCKQCLSLQPGHIAGIYGFNVSLGGNISVNYYVKLDDAVITDPDAKMVFGVPESGGFYTVEVPVSEAKKVSGFYVFTCEVAVKEITSDIQAQVVTSDASSDVMYYQIMTYAQSVLANPGKYANEVSLVKALLNYSAAAQIYLDHNTDNLANATEYMSAEDKVLADVDLSDYAYTVSGEQAGVSFYGANLSLESETAIKLYFTIEGDASTLEMSVNGMPVTAEKNGSYYVIKISDIAAHQLGNMYEIKVGGLTLRYGAFSYGNKAMSGSNEKLKDTIRALYAYYMAAVDYKN